MADVKPGKVIRVSPEVWRVLSREKEGRETVDKLIRRLIGLAPKKRKTIRTYFILPESRIICETAAEARGIAIVRHAKSGKKIPIEKPIEVREVV